MSEDCHSLIAVIDGRSQTQNQQDCDTQDFRILEQDEAERQFNPGRDKEQDLFEKLREIFGSIGQALKWFENQVDDFETELQTLLRKLDFETKKWGEPPRSTVSRARSPAVRRWWINYKARDKLPRNSLKSGGKRKCQRKRSAYRTQCLP